MADLTSTFASELKRNGTYGIEGTWYGAPYTPVERFNPPITPRDNMRRYYEGGDYLWIPDGGSDQVDITPDNIPDVVACGFGGGLDSFGVEWVPVDIEDLPAMVKPGDPKLKDITKWRDLDWPDVSSWEWEKYGRMYDDALGEERYRRGVILSSYFERLISLMDFEQAAMAMVTNPDDVYSFFDRLTDVNIAIAEHYKEYFDTDCIMPHDDWAAQRSPFFSLKMVRKLIVPHLKRLVDRTHELGMKLTLHSCGNGNALVPAMVEAGVDTWQLQEDAADYKKALEQHGKTIFVEGYFALPDGSDNETKQYMEEVISSLGRNSRGMYQFYDFSEGRGFDIREYAYLKSREVAEQRRQALES